MSHTLLDVENVCTLKYIITHVFFPPRLPSFEDDAIENDRLLAGAVASAARLYSTQLSDRADRSLWQRLSRMLENAQASVASERLDRFKTIFQLGSMEVNDVTVLLLRAQNSGVIFRKQADVTLFEAFEILPRLESVMSTQGKLVCSYPGPVIALANETFEDKYFRFQLVNFLVHMSYDNVCTSSWSDPRENAPRFITELLTGILRSVGRPAEVTRISKRVGDDVVCNDEGMLPWRRSALWLLIKVTLQTTLGPSSLHTYKAFMLFFMCRLADERACTKLPSDLLQFMSAKIGRRLNKLSPSCPVWLTDHALRTCTKLGEMIETRWREFQADQRRSPAWMVPTRHDLARDIQLSLSTSREYILNALAHQSSPLPVVLFDPEHRPRGSLDDFLSDDGASFFDDAYRLEPYLTLYDVELAVEQHIDAWVRRVRDSDEACARLETLANKYAFSASKTYATDNPELLSIMLLTLIELWVALDKIALRQVPILADYSPEVPIGLLENLLLPKATNRDRLRRAYRYLVHRYSRSTQGSVFSSTFTTKSFPVRFYRTSGHLQDLRARIEARAWEDVSAKTAELREMNKRYAELQTRATETDNNGDDATNTATTHMDMDIAVHEWPLPSDQLQAEVVVFELDCPVSFDMWRTATLHLLVDVCSSPVEHSGDGARITLGTYKPLMPHHVKHPRARVSLGSNTRSSAFTHPTVAIPAQQTQVCIKNPLIFFGYDTCTKHATSDVLGNGDSKKYCTYALQAGPYKNLQQYVDSTAHTSNDVVASQADCHEDLSMHEYIAFGHIRSGHLLQWLNILRELRARSLTFRRPEIYMLIAQATSQVGPLENEAWAWHGVLQRPAFCLALLRELSCLVQDVRTNWTEAVTIDTVSLLVRRLLGSNRDTDVSSNAIILLRTLRGIAFSWVRDLAVQVVTNAPDDDDEASSSRGVLRDVAAICRSTYDVDPDMIPYLLRSSSDLDVLLTCAVIVHEHVPSDITMLSAYARLLLDRDSRLSLSLERVVSEMIIQTDAGKQGIDSAVRRMWSEYRPGSTWRPLPGPNARWFSCTTQSGQAVHMNTLDGSLLVDGRPLGTWLPNEYVRHPLYKRIFGEKTRTVTRSDLPGMDYVTRGTIADHQVYFSLRNNDTDLVIRARRQGIDDDDDVLELVPPEKLEGDLPNVLVEDHVHWLNLSSSVLEIRPCHHLWQTDSENWRLECKKNGYRMMRKDCEYLVDVRSPSWRAVSRLLRPLGTRQDLIVSVSEIGDSKSLQLSAFFPHHDLSFYVDEDGDLRSRNIRDMVYDENQSVGTLFGLTNQLVLRPKDEDVNALGLVPRCVLIPDGEVTYHTHGDHVRVQVTPRPPTPTRGATYHVYKVNTDLGCLSGNGSLTSKLYIAYMHALTNGCRVDPLTGRTGTEEALSILRSADCGSYARFTPRDTELLIQIASLCPLRTWHLKKSIQKVQWHDLPANSQHPELYVLCRTIKERYERAQSFHEQRPLDVLFDDFPSQEDVLLKRAVYAFSGNVCAENGDTQYSARDVVDNASGELRAYTAAMYVCSWTAATSTKDIWKMVGSWKGRVTGVSTDSVMSLQYDRSWLAPDLSFVWLKTYNLLRADDERKRFQLLFSLPAMAYASPNESDLVPMWVAFASCPEFESEDPPKYDAYTIAKGDHPSMVTLHKCVVDCAYPLEQSPERFAPALHAEGFDDLQHRQRRMYNNRRRADADMTARAWLSAWPCETCPSCMLDPKLYDVSALESNVLQHFSECFRNLRLKEHLTRVQTILDDLHSQATSPSESAVPSYAFQPCRIVPPRNPWRVTVEQLFARPAPLLKAHDELPRCATEIGSTLPPDTTSLRRLIAAVGTNARNGFQRRYLEALETSAEAFEREAVVAVDYEPTEQPLEDVLEEHYAWCKSSYVAALQHLKRQLGPKSKPERALEQAGQWPCFTADTFFRCLASNALITVPQAWKRTLTTLALLALELQRARRLCLLYLEKLHDELWKELRNEGCNDWDPEVYPDWLLVQLQGNFLIRRVQAEVASEMISPSLGDSTAMQLNMGEGKTSVIVPIVAAVLANGKRLVRIVVPKPLTAQTLHLLADRLGGLANRRLYYIPYTRFLEASDERITSLYEIMLECMQERGILVLQPEHVLSLKLVSVEKQLDGGGSAVAHKLLELQKWLHVHARDVLDESDEILNVRSQMVFTVGRQQSVQGSPERWTTTEQVLGLVGKYASSLRAMFPREVEYDPGPPGSFPYLRILQTNAGEKLVSWIIQDVLKERLPNITLGPLRLRLEFMDALQCFLSREDVPDEQVDLLKKCCGESVSWDELLLLRGLLSAGLLLFAFRERRWRVDYGLAPARTLLAVPYRAKDMPSQRAEFGHPDMSIILTCLSYYYAGLDEEQLRASFGILLKQHDPSLDYDLWVEACPDVPRSLSNVSGVNIESAEQWSNSLVPLFSRNRATINFYLSKVVFPREAKEFPWKLHSSGWDLVEKKEQPVTGFSGTNDGQYLFPEYITQCDPVHQQGSNAKVLSYLLQPENNHYVCLTRKNGKRPTTQDFLETLVAQKPEIRVLLDVGAQMLDLTNRELAEEWLKITPNASAGIYFNEFDELTVCMRDGSRQSLLSSPYAEQLGQCVVYVDDAHTRGTDIKFPIGFRAAVTLGPKVTKDRLVQGCMRMRRLGHGHSVMFFAPLEVDGQIRTLTGKDKVNTTDVLQWTIQETWENIRRWAPQCVLQGLDHKSRHSAWSEFCRGQLASEDLSKGWLQPGSRTLEDLYRPREGLNADIPNVLDIPSHFIDLGIQSLSTGGVDEEQERELVHDVKHEAGRPLNAPPATHSIHPGVTRFVKTGLIDNLSDDALRPWMKGFMPAFETLHTTSAATEEAYVWSQSVLVTTDFERTVKLTGKMDDYLRPVQWIVSAKRPFNDWLVVLSPFEVNCLLPTISLSKKVHLHLYTPRTLKSMKPCDDLTLYSIPSVPHGWKSPSYLMDQLGTFAGQLYLKDHASYIRLCRFLCLYSADLEVERGIRVEPDGFIKPENRPNPDHTLTLVPHTFSDSPLVSVRALMDIRSKGIQFTSTHMGKLLRGRLLSSDDFEKSECT